MLCSHVLLRLYLQNNQITVIPECIGALTNLTRCEEWLSGVLFSHVLLRLYLSGNKGLPEDLARDTWDHNVAEHLTNLAKYGAVFSAHFGALWTMHAIGDVWPDLSEIVCERLFSANLDEWAKKKL